MIQVSVTAYRPELRQSFLRRGRTNK